jgi:hypothetical protein
LRLVLEGDTWPDIAVVKTTKMARAGTRMGMERLEPWKSARGVLTTTVSGEEVRDDEMSTITTAYRSLTESPAAKDSGNAKLHCDNAATAWPPPHGEATTMACDRSMTADTVLEKVVGRRLGASRDVSDDIGMANMALSPAGLIKSQAAPSV